MANIFFGRGKKKTLVVESSNIGLRAIGLEVTEDSITIEKAYYSSWSLFLSQTPDDFSAKLSTVMKSLASYCSPKEYSVVYCCSDSNNWNHWAQTALIEDEEELEEYLISKKIIRDPELWISDSMILGNSISSEKESIDVLVQMVKSENAQLVMDILEESGYELEAIEFLPNALISFYEYYCDENRTNHDAIISIGWENSVVSIFHDNQLRFSYFLNFRLSDFTVLLIQKMQLDESTAMDIVKSELFDVVLGDQANNRDLMPQILDEVKLELEFLQDELKRVFAFYVTKVMEWKIEGIERVVFAGHEVNMNSLHNFISTQISVPSVTISPIDNVDYSAEVSSKLEGSDSSQFLNNTFGLSLRHIGS